MTEKKDKKPFYKRIWVWVLVALVIVFIIWARQPAYEDYKTDAREVTWMELADDEVSGNEKVTFSGTVSEESTDETLIVSDNDGVYYVKNNDDFDIKVNDEIIIWGVYVGDQSDTGLPIIDAKVMEVK